MNYSLPYDVDGNGLAETWLNRERLTESLKSIYEKWWRVDEERDSLDDIAERILGQRVFCYTAYPVAKLSALYTAWDGHMEAKYQKIRAGAA